MSAVKLASTGLYSYVSRLTRRLPFLAMLFVTAVLSARPQQQREARTLEVSGRVVDAVNGTPVEGVRVTLLAQKAPAVSTLTDEHGRFVLQAPGPGQYQLSGSLHSRAFALYGADPFSGDPAWFSLSARMTGVVLKLWHVPHVSGTVLDEHDQPVAGALVIVMRPTTLGNRHLVRESFRGPTNAAGRYSLDVITPCRCLVLVVPHLTQAGPAQPPQYYPGVRSAAAASPVDLVQGQSATADFHLHPERGFVVSGAVQLPPDFEGKDYVDLFDLSSPDSPSRIPAAHVAISPYGAFSFPLVSAGSYEVRFLRYAAHAPDDVLDGVVRYDDQQLRTERLAPVPAGPTWWAAERVTVVDKDVTVSLPARPGVRVSGRVVFEGPGTPPDPSLLPTRGINLRSVDYRFFDPFQVARAGEDGRFRTVAVPPGEYALGMVGPFGASDPFPGYQLTSVRVDGREVGGVSFTLDHEVTNAVLTFSSHPTEIRGSVSERVNEHAFVIAWPVDERQWSGRGTEMGRVVLTRVTNGTYRLPVFPGAYRVAAVAGEPPRDWQATDYLRSLAGGAERVEVTVGQSAVRNLVTGRSPAPGGS
jgi:Carboxypeptidase regulatory-like domain